MSSSIRSQASHSTTGNNSQHSMNREDIPLETLVSHLLASKRSLSSIHSVWRANQIVTSARLALEESMVLGARTGFLRRGISDQVRILRKVRGGIESVYKDGQKDFKNVIRTLDAANARLESTMDILRSTMVEAAFRPAEEEPRSLLDFVDEQGVETMRDALKDSIRESRESQTEFDSTLLSFDSALRTLRNAMTTSPKTSSQSLSTPLSPIPTHLQSLEDHAQELASLLESLTSHFDLCVNAIRHTEGGYAAVRKAASNPPPGSEPVSVSGVMTSSGEQTHDLEPISEEERQEMLTVLETDAAEVEDVVMEIRDRLSDIESKHDIILEHLSLLKTTYQETLSAYNILESISTRLSTYIIASQEFRLRWEETKAQIQEQSEELESMRVFYENYFACYDSLILEVERRRHVEEKIRGVMRKAMEQVERLQETDEREREGFRVDVGDFLPVDLWPGVNVGARRWGFGVCGGEGEEGGGGGDGKGREPVLESSTVEKAARRDRERRRGEKR